MVEIAADIRGHGRLGMRVPLTRVLCADDLEAVVHFWSGERLVVPLHTPPVPPQHDAPQAP